MYVTSPRKNPLILFLVKIASFFFILPYRIFHGSHVTFGKNFITDWRLKLDGPGKITFGDNVFAWGRKEPNILITLNPDATIRVGDNVRLNGAEIQAAKSISIGANSIIGSANIIDTDFHSVAIDRATNQNSPVVSKPIVINENVWIAGRSAVLRGVTIGKNSVIGYGSIVREDIPENVVALGNPARVVRPVN
jgi:acyl-[acyl carrier protein]--UDP-N-acetylglucosamine O-acyltransferase